MSKIKDNGINEKFYFQIGSIHVFFFFFLFCFIQKMKIIIINLRESIINIRHGPESTGAPSRMAKRENHYNLDYE